MTSALVAGCVGASISTLFLGWGGGALEAMGRNATLTGRTDIWKLVLGMSGNPLIGTGYESFWLGDRMWKIWNVYYFHLNEAHNGYIEIYLNLGWIGVALLALILATGYKNVLVALRDDPGLGALRLAFFSAGVIYSFTEAGFRMLTLIWMALLLAVTAGPDRGIERSSPALFIEDAEDAPEVEYDFDQVYRVDGLEEMA